MSHVKKTESVQGRLVPLEVPWQISPSTSFLRLHASECPQDDPVRIVFIAYLGLENNRMLPQSKEQVAQRVPPTTEAISSGAGYCEVRVTFDTGLWCRMSPACSDSETIRENAYDWSQVKCTWDGEQDIDEWLYAFKKLWRETGMCPDPRIYQVEDSEWLRSIGSCLGTEWKHYLVVGHDNYVEVIAKSCKWEKI